MDTVTENNKMTNTGMNIKQLTATEHEEKRQSDRNEDTYKTNVTNQKRTERLKQTKDATD